MSRVSDEELGRIKRQVKVADLCADYGIELKRVGPDNLMGLCPFHDDQNPSFGVTPSKNLWNCLAGCGGGDVIQLVMRREGVSFRHAVEKLRQRLGVSPDPAPVHQTPVGTRHEVLVPPGDTDLADHALLNRVCSFYHQTFCNEPKAMKYLQKRRCFDPEAVKVFQIGYANRTLGYRVPTTTAPGRRLKAQLKRLGVFRGSGHEHLSGSVVVPVFDEHGNVCQMYGRKITPGLREGTPLHLYLLGEHRAVWNARTLRVGGGQKEWLLCESILDALTLWCAGYRNVTCSYGVNGFTAAHWSLVEEVEPKRVVICYDNDPAGNRAATKLADQLRERGIVVARASLGEGQDINALACRSRDARAALAIALETDGAVGKEECSMEGEANAAVDAPPSSFPTARVEESEPPPDSPEEDPPPRTPELPDLDQSADASELPGSLARPGAGGLPGAGVLPGEEVTFSFGPRRWRVRGIGKNLAYETLRVQLRLLVEGGEQARFHLDVVDLCSAKHRQGFIAHACAETGLDEGLLKRDLGRVYLESEALQEKAIREATAPKHQAPPLNETDREAALTLLKDPNLLDRILEDFHACGVVGEGVNKLVGYLAAVSRKLDEPLAVIIQSTSAAGKSSLMESVLSFVPSEDLVKYSAMTGQSLYYLGHSDLTHKVLAVAEEEGAERASYALKLLQSEGELTIASTGKDTSTGRMVAQEYHVKGPVSIMLTTTAIDLDEELLNRCIVLTVDESREQTRAIHELQRERETFEGMRLKLGREAVLKLHHDSQRLLRPLRVVNPYAKQLTFLDDKTRTRRDHMKYLGLIRTIALLHQYQRPRKTSKHRGQVIEYIEVEPGDIAVANRIAAEVLGRSLDELPPQTRRLLGLIERWVAGECKRLHERRGDFRFTRRDVREATGWGNTQLKVHLSRLEEMEYLLVHRGGQPSRGPASSGRGNFRGGFRGYVYELLYEGQGEDGELFLMGLADAEQLKPPEPDPPAGQGRPVVGARSAQEQPPSNA